MRSPIKFAHCKVHMNERMNKPTWLFVDGAQNFGGHEVMLLRWLQELYAQDRVCAMLLARAQSKLFAQGSAYAHTIALPMNVGSQSSRNIFKIFTAMMRDMRTFVSAYKRVRPTLVIVAEGCLLAQATFTVMSWLLRGKTIIYVPLVEPAKNMGFASGPLRDWLVRHLYRHLPTAWLTLSPPLATQLAAWTGIKQPVYVLPNALSSQIERVSGTNSIAHRPLRVLVLGRLDAHQKNLDSLLGYLAQRPQLGQEMCISLVGEGPFGPQMKQFLEARPTLARWVVLKPWADTIEVMTQHDVLLLVSRYEGVPLVVLEAMALGLPVATTDLPGVRDLIAAECRFDFNDFEKAFTILHRLSLPHHRAKVIDDNLRAVYSRASGIEFARSVRNLTDVLMKLTDRNLVAEVGEEIVDS